MENIYYILTDEYYMNELIKEENNEHFRFIYGPNKWYKTDLFNNYLNIESFCYNKYTKLHTEQAKEIITNQMHYYAMLWNIAYDIANEAHKDLLDKAGKPYILHPKYIADKFQEYELKIIAILHDVVEDSDITLEYLIEKGFPRKIIDAIDAITKRKDEKYFDYILRVKANNLATKVKIEDLKHNMDLTRFDGEININIESLQKRYKKAFDILTK